MPLCYLTLRLTNTAKEKTHTYQKLAGAFEIHLCKLQRDDQQQQQISVYTLQRTHGNPKTKLDLQAAA